MAFFFESENRNETAATVRYRILKLTSEKVHRLKKLSIELVTGYYYAKFAQPYTKKNGNFLITTKFTQTKVYS